MARVELPKKLPSEEFATLVAKSGRLDIRNVDGGEEPFLYSSGNYGPGYLDIKGACGIDEVFEVFTQQSALSLLEAEAQFDFIAGNATGGMIPAYRVKQIVSEWTGRPVPFVYLRNTRKLGGQQEYATGTARNPNITPTEAVQMGANILVCGTPIYNHPKPAEALRRILEEIAYA